MKITPAKDYKKPLYAIGISAAIMALSVTGCTNPAEKKEPDLAGAAVICTDTTEGTKKDADNDPEPILEGEALPYIEDEDTVIVYKPDDLTLTGGAPIEED